MRRRGRVWRLLGRAGLGRGGWVFVAAAAAAYVLVLLLFEALVVFVRVCGVALLFKVSESEWRAF